MFARRIEICCQQVVPTEKLRYWTIEKNRRSSRLLITSIQVIPLLNPSKLAHCGNPGWINCLRWNSSRDMVATASNDNTTNLLDFKTGEILHTCTTCKGRNFISDWLIIDLNYTLLILFISFKQECMYDKQIRKVYSKSDIYFYSLDSYSIARYLKFG
jgi:WD40 repeat protein